MVRSIFCGFFSRWLISICIEELVLFEVGLFDLVSIKVFLDGESMEEEMFGFFVEFLDVSV